MNRHIALWSLIMTATAVAAPAKPSIEYTTTTGLKQSGLTERLAPGPSNELAFVHDLQRLLSGVLRPGVTSLLVADARTGEPVFALRPDEGLNPASNVKLISTATVLDLLGGDFQFTTRLLGTSPAPARPDLIASDVYLLGNYDPLLAASDLDAFAAALAAQGIKRIEGNIVTGDGDRDGLYGARFPIRLRAGKPGTRLTLERDFDDGVTEYVVEASSARRGRPRITIAQQEVAPGQFRVRITGTLPHDTVLERWVKIGNRPLYSAQRLRHALLQQGITVTGHIAQEPVGTFVVRMALRGAWTQTLAAHASPPVSAIVASINKRSINWLADRMVAIAAGFREGQAPSMTLALEAMQGWLRDKAHVNAADYVVDTGSGLSYQTKLSATQLVRTIRAAAGFNGTTSSYLATSWMNSLAIAGQDGTLAGRFRSGQFSGRLRGKTGTLSTVIALSGILSVNPDRPLVFALVTNDHAPRYRNRIRKAHEQVIASLTAYAAARDSLPLYPASPAPLQPAPPASAPGPETLDEDEGAELGGDSAQ